VRRRINTPKAEQEFITDLASTSIMEKLDRSLETDPNNNFDIMSKELKQKRDIHFPTKFEKFNKHKHKGNKWITHGIIKSIEYRDALHLKLKRCVSSNSNYDTLKHNISVYNCILKKTIREARMSYYYTAFEKYKFDIKSTWKTIGEVLSRRRGKSSIDEIIINDELITDKSAIANEFNKFFVNIGAKLASLIDCKDKKSFKSYLKNVINSRFHFELIDEAHVLKVIQSLKSKTSYGYDGISTCLLKKIAHILVHPLTLIINQSLVSGIVPEAIKIAKVIPLHKKDDKRVLDNYRPVSLLTAISKVFERVVHIQLNEYFKKHSLYHESQYGFRENHSTEMATLELVDRINADLDKKGMSLAVFKDLSKAFDTLDHSILMHKLNYYGISGVELSWFKSYLSNRKQFVEMDGTRSDLLTITTGVPQGSILGPILFLIYINDVTKASSYFKFILYADDTSLYNNLRMNISPGDDPVNIIDSELNKIYDWLAVNKLSLNIKKTKYMIFHRPNVKVPDNIKLVINGIELERVANFNFLGININENLSWKPHVTKTSNKISRYIGILNKLKRFLPQYILKTLYLSMVQSQLIYGILLWGFDCERLFRLQKKCMRIISISSFNAHTDPLFKYFEVLKVRDLFHVTGLKFYYKLMHGKLPSYFNTFILQSNDQRHTYHTRHGHIFPMFVTRTRFAQKCLRNKLPHIINNTSQCVMMKINTHSFRGFSFYAKLKSLEMYSMSCNVHNCYVCERCLP
jgi:hypothetical protein